MTVKEMIIRIQKGDQVALARAISKVENREQDYKKLLAGVSLPEKPALKIGVSGAPGCGKSTIIARMVEAFSQRNIRIGVVAVDPTSPLTGGALLADRIRLNDVENKSDVFIRSLANRGFLGGLNNTVPEVMLLLEAAGYNVIIVETVGVGQSEVDIAYVADVVVLVITPTRGDEIQVMKAGIMEITDLYVINKSDLGGADLKEQQIQSIYYQSQDDPSIFQTSATQNHGIDELVAYIYRLPHSRQQQIKGKKEKFKRHFILRLLNQKILLKIEQDPQLVRFLDDQQGMDPYKTADALFKKVCRGGRDGKKN